MKFVKYSKYVADPLEGLSAEDLLQLLQNFLLDSGFYNQYYNFYEMDPERTLEQLHQALLEAMREQGMIPEELLDRKSTRLNSSHGYISYAVFCLKKKTDQFIVEAWSKHAVGA